MKLRLATVLIALCPTIVEAVGSRPDFVVLAFPQVDMACTRATVIVVAAIATVDYILGNLEVVVVVIAAAYMPVALSAAADTVDTITHPGIPVEAIIIKEELAFAAGILAVVVVAMHITTLLMVVHIVSLGAECIAISHLE